MSTEETSKLTGTEPASTRAEHDVQDIVGKPPAKTIGWFGSLSLVANNISGPAMMGLPIVFREAGIIPTILCILVTWVMSSLCGTFLAETIQKLPGNEKFEKNVDFSYIFSKVVGKQWHLRCEVLVIISCAVCCFAGIVETAQSLDSWLASFVLGKTYAVTIPGMEFITWDASGCIGEVEGDVQDESNTGDCTPFHFVDGSVITLGYMLTFAFFYPLGRNDLNETIWAQVVTFLLMFLLIMQFMREFASTGYPYMDSVPMVGTNFKTLAGVVLFNYAYPITIPSWLIEKKSDVPVNKIIWTASFTSTVMYISFGILAAASYDKPGENVLVVLASNKTAPATQFASAFFGISEIGVGVAIFCVIVKNSLLQTGLMNKGLSQFFGSLFPYLISWYMYQGKTLLVMLNWTGLLVNGMVAFILPLVVALVAYRNGYGPKSRSNSSTSIGGDIEMLGSTNTNSGKYNYQSIDDNALPTGDDYDNSDGEEGELDIIKPLPSAIEPCRGIVLILGILIFSFMIVSTVILDVEYDATPDTRRF